MAPETWTRLRELFAAAVRLDPAERSAFLEDRCGEDRDLRRQLDALLVHDAETRGRSGDRIAGVVEAAAGEVVETAAAAASLEGRRIGKIQVLELLGRGGMGEVYVGFDETLQRRVALKAIHARHRLSADARARFLREARILSQLDHPAICRIHEYIEGEDRDFLVLELIEGRNLADAVAAGLGPGERMRVAIRIVEALTAAHGKGIVHRDLKPHNVMVTPDAEVRVLDFGLARSGEPAAAGRPPDPPAAARADPERDPSPGLRTERGQVLGTPVFMSPEQARGETATTASDMYAFGLLLQVLFTGASPYPEGLDSKAVLDRARRAETRPVHGVDRDLAALIGALKAPEPAYRPTATAALERLRWIRDKPKRRARRLAAAGVLALAVLAGAKYTYDLRVARDEADRRRGQAEDLISFILGDLREELEPVGQLEVLDDVGDKALDYFALLREDELTDDELFRRAKALAQIGEVRIAQGELDDALASLEEARSLAASLVARDPAVGEWQHGLGTVHFWTGNVHWLRGERDDALAHFEDYLDIARRLVALDPDNLDWRQELAYAHTNVGAVHEARGELDRAMEAVRLSNDIKRALVAAEPSNAERARSLANGLSWQGAILLSAGRVDDSLAQYRAELEIRRRLAAERPQDTDAAHLLALAHGLVAELSAMAGDVAAAREHHRAAGRDLERLVDHDPANVVWRRDLGIGHHRLAESHLLAGDLAAAAAAVEDARRLLASLAAGDPSNDYLRRELAATDQQAAAVYLAAGDLEASLRAARSALEGLEGLAPDDRQALQIRGRSRVTLGRALARGGRRSEAAAAWTRAADELAALDPGVRHPRLLDPRARALLHLGRHDEAAPILRSLAASGYAHPDLVALASGRGVWPGLPIPEPTRSPR